MHADGEVAARQGRQQRRDLLQAAGVGVEQAVDLLCQLQEEAVLADGVDAAAEVAGGSGGDHACHFLLHQCLGGAVTPFNNIAHRRPGLVTDHRDGLCELGAAEAHLAFEHARLLQHVDDLAVHFAAVLQRGDMLADQRFAGIVMGELGGDVLAVFGKLVLQGAVGVNDFQVGVGQVYAGGGVVQCGADAQVLVGNDLVTLDALAQIALHALHGAEQVADFITARNIDMAIQLAAGNLVGHVDRTAHGANQRAGKQPYQHQPGNDADQYGDHDQYCGCGIGLGGLFGSGLGAGVVVGGQCLQRRIGLAVHVAGFADEGVDGVIREFQLQHLGDRVIGTFRGLPVSDEGIKKLLLLRIVDQPGICGDGCIDLLAQLACSRLGVCFHLVTGTYQALVGGIAILADHAAQFAGGAQAGHAVVGEIGGDVVERVQATVGHDALQQHDEQHDAKGKHQLRLEFQRVDPMHLALSPETAPRPYSAEDHAGSAGVHTGMIT